MTLKALIIDEPWIGLILSGQKTWEMRKTACDYRGPVALIRKGSGQVVGTARVIGSLPSLDSAEDYAAAEPHHRIPPDRQVRARQDGWATPWVLVEAKPLAQPVGYRHSSGAVIWVNLEQEVAAAVVALAGEAFGDVVDASTTHAPTSSTRHPEPEVVAPSPVVDEPSGDARTVVITGGNIRNNHIYLPLEFFPANAIGGKNKDEAAPRQLSVTFQPGQVVHADIDGTKRILRARGPVKDFIARAGIVEGKVVISRHNPYAYFISRQGAE